MRWSMKMWFIWNVQKKTMYTLVPIVDISDFKRSLAWSRRLRWWRSRYSTLQVPEPEQWSVWYDGCSRSWLFVPTEDRNDTHITDPRLAQSLLRHLQQEHRQYCVLGLIQIHCFSTYLVPIGKSHQLLGPAKAEWISYSMEEDDLRRNCSTGPGATRANLTGTLAFGDKNEIAHTLYHFLQL